MDQEAFGEMTNRYAKWIGQYFVALAEADVPIAMIHDDLVWANGPFISPDWYREYIFPNIKKNIVHILIYLMLASSFS